MTEIFHQMFSLFFHVQFNVKFSSSERFLPLFSVSNFLAVFLHQISANDSFLYSLAFILPFMLSCHFFSNSQLHLRIFYAHLSHLSQNSGSNFDRNFFNFFNFYLFLYFFI